MITGSIVAIVTPMNADGSLDLEAFRNLVDFHIREKTDAIVVVGTTGESPTVDVDEHCLLIEQAVKHAGGRIPIIAVTAHALKGDRERYLASGMDGYVSKPLSPEALKAEMLRCMAAVQAPA